MKKIGLLAGIGPESTLDYYKRIIAAFRRIRGGFHTPEIIIYSADMGEALSILDAEDWGKLTDWVVSRIYALHAAGAEFAAIASNTPHAVINEVRARSPLPLISIVEETLGRVVSMGLKRPGLLGTRFAMRHGFYQRVFDNAGISVVIPEEPEQDLIHNRLFTEIELGIIKDSTRSEFLSIVEDMIDGHAIDCIILGCTELPLILDKDEFGIPFLDTTGIHVDGIVKYCIGEN